MEILTEDIQADHLPDWPPPHAVVSVADVVAAVGPGDVLHDELLPGDGEIGAKAPGEGEIVLKYFLVNIFSNDPIPPPSRADTSQISVSVIQHQLTTSKHLSRDLLRIVFNTVLYSTGFIIIPCHTTAGSIWMTTDWLI